MRVWYEIVYGMVKYCMVRHGILWYGMILYDVFWHGMEYKRVYDIVWCVMVRYGLVMVCGAVL